MDNIISIPLEEYISLQLVHNKLKSVRQQNESLLQEKETCRLEIQDIQNKIILQQEMIQHTTCKLAKLRKECEVEKQKIGLMTQLPREEPLVYKVNKTCCKIDSCDSEEVLVKPRICINPESYDTQDDTDSLFSSPQLTNETSAYRLRNGLPRPSQSLL
ncbi:hypothetical protein EIN_047310 [Entamoeba invadens IP1]|uniref:Uncharacterized protein n=1 Tax=Entamoeba invadens IP1 TaxID=370355 RepID=A0A0A1UDC8_ENTIV|nr:hypothetical protein EIN_047310 [Entamoeba invadens IP1]ELP94438.1 hypothetical protein EIN_047310 [Entamoeba invadens IP1]|eukprot:XP_004261209.1 hypothetical protein EIN_047310 [Entamoeba invadens IP1]